MDISKNNVSLIFLSRNRFEYYSFAQESLLVFEFSKEAVRDLEVVNQEVFLSQIGNFIESNKISPSLLIIVLSKEILYEKDFIDGDQIQIDLRIQEFLDNIPYETVASKKIPLEKGFRVVAANQDLFKSVQLGFENRKFKVSEVLAAPLLGLEAEGLTPQIAKNLREKAESEKNLSFLVINQEKQILTSEEKLKKKNYILILAFVILILVASALFLRAFGLI